MVKLNKIHHIGYWTDDLDGTIERYRATWGVDDLVRAESSVLSAKIAFVRSGNTLVEIMQPADLTALGGKTGLILHHVAYEVDDIEKAIAEMRAAGVRFRPGVPNPGAAGPIAYLEDDQLGSAFHLIQPIERFRLG